MVLGFSAFLFAGCAASNGGGHVVGNSMMKEETGTAMAKGHEKCGCEDAQGKMHCGEGGVACACASEACTHHDHGKQKHKKGAKVKSKSAKY